MAFEYRWMFNNDVVDSADRFAREAELRLSGCSDFLERADAATVIWGELHDLGWSYLMLDEASGGIGGDLNDLASILEGGGRHAVPLPLLAAFGIAPLLLNAAGEAGKGVAAQIVEGQAVLMPVIESLARRARGKAGRITCRREGAQLHLDGTLLGVEAVPRASHLLIACEMEGEGASPQAALIVCPVAQPGLAMAATRRMDARGAFDLEFSGAVLDADALLASGGDLAETVDRIADTGSLMTGVEAIAAMGALIRETIEYLSVRKQFNVALGSFQVLRHYVADMVAAYEITHALLLHTLRLAGPHGADPAKCREAISLFRLRVSAAGRLIARQAIQLHGGMGVTEELLATRLARRIMMAEFEYGDEAFHAARLLEMRA